MCAVSTVGFLLQVTITRLSATLSLLVTIGFISKYASRKVLCVAGFLMLVGFSLGLVSFYYDRSWDGNAYHKLSAGLIESGWNPVYTQFGDFANDSGRFLRHNWAGFYDGYPKASYIIGASIYAVTGAIESGKVFTILSLLSALGAISVLVKEVAGIKLWQSFTVACLACVNTLTIGELFTFYNDAFLSMCVFSSTFGLVYLSIESDGRYDRFAWLLVFVNVTLGLNLKFSALFIFAVMGSVFLSIRAWMAWRVGPSEFRGFLKRISLYYSAIAVFAFVVLGATSYVHNAALYGNPLYPLSLNDADTSDPTLSALPEQYQALPPVQQFLGSMFSKVAMEPSLKVPFTFDKQEASASVESVFKLVGGWGIWFSGILVASLISYLFIARRVKRSLNVTFLTILAASFLPTFVLPYLNNARFWPLPFLIPPFVLLLFFSTTSLGPKALAAVATLFAVNLAPPILGVAVATKISYEAHRKFSEMKEAVRSADRPIVVSLGSPDPVVPGEEPVPLNGLLYNLDSLGVRNFIQVAPENVRGFNGKWIFIPLSHNSRGAPIGIDYLALHCSDRRPELADCVAH